MPRLNGIDAARIIRKEVPSTNVLFLTMDDEATLIKEAFRAGAAGFVLKTAGMEELSKAIRSVAQGERYVTPLLTRDPISTLVTPGQRSGETELTRRQRHVLQLIAEGKTMKEAATVMGISVRTAECHKYTVMRKLGVRTIAELIRHAIRLKLV
jgi:DNA-binding NarL/FixJ family response regulator